MKKDEQPRCPMVDRCAHPRDGRVGHGGRCVDCGHQVTARVVNRPTSRGGGVIAQIDYEGTVMT